MGETVQQKAFTQEDKISVFSTMEDDVESIFKDPEEAKKVRRLLQEAKEQSEKKVVRVTRECGSVKKFVNLWRTRFRYGIHWSKLGYPFRLVWNVGRGKLYNLLGIRRYVLRGIEFAITFRCNFRCNHCLCARIDETGKRREMTPSDYARVVQEAMDLGATTFGMEGGEPFVVKDWDKFIEAWQPHKNHIIITTNGYLFDEQKAKRAAELGVDTINFSLDSGIPELHDLFRCKRGAYDRVMEGIKLCRKHGIKVIINTCVHKGNLYTDGFRDLLEFCEREELLVNTLFAKGVGNFHNKEVMLDEEDLKAYQRIVEPYTWVTRHLNFNYGKQWGCPGTKEMINMTPYGDVMNCANMHIYMGNVMEEPLAVARERALRETPFGRYHACFLADDPDFMKIYYTRLQKHGSMTIPEFRASLAEYEKEHGKVLYPELYEGGSKN